MNVERVETREVYKDKKKRRTVVSVYPDQKRARLFVCMWTRQFLFYKTAINGSVGIVMPYWPTFYQP